MFPQLEEARRLNILRRYAILDTPPEPVFDRIAWMAATHFGTPIGTVTFIDENRQWFKAIHGLSISETLREIAFCNYTIRQDDVMVVADALDDERFATNPLVTDHPRIRFYAGAPLVTQEGLKLGTVSVIDDRPHPDPISTADERFLKELARIVVDELEMRMAAGDVRREIEHRRRVERDLQRTNDCFRLAIQHSPISLFTQDTDYKFTWAINTPPPFTPERLIGRTDDELFSGPALETIISAKARAMNEGRPVRTDVVMDLRGQRHYFDATFEPMRDDGGNIVGLAAAAMDVTEHRSAEEMRTRALAEAERANMAKSRFLAAASHDLRQPMQSLMLLLAVLHERLRRQPGTRKVADSAQAAAEAMRGLLDDLLDISRIEAGLVRSDPKPSDISPLLERLAMEYDPRARAKGLQFRVRSCGGWVMTDLTLLERILRNLLENALRYTNEGGIMLACRPRANRLRIEVIDTGIGMAPEHRETIFEEFVQLGNSERDRTKGLGLGLAIVRRLGDILELPVQVSSHPGRGSRFYMDLPRAAPPRDLTHGCANGARRLCGRVLVIDDERMVLDALGSVLGGWGLEVVTADSAAEGVEKLHGRAPDAILADYRLRGGANGVQAVRMVQESFGVSIPAVIITGDTSPQRLTEAQASGHMLLHKPVTPEDLRRKVETVLPPRH